MKLKTILSLLIFVFGLQYGKLYSQDIPFFADKVEYIYTAQDNDTLREIFRIDSVLQNANTTFFYPSKRIKQYSHGYRI